MRENNKKAHGLSYHCYADDTQLFLSFPPTDTQAPACISACLSDISSWMSTNHLRLNLAKTELLYLPAKYSPLADLSITIENVVVTPSTVAKNLGVVLDDRLDFSSHIASTTRACRFFLNNVRRIRPFLSKKATQLLVQALVLPRLDYCNSLLLAGLRPQTPPASPERSGQADLVSAEVGPRDPAADRPALAPDCCTDPLQDPRPGVPCGERNSPLLPAADGLRLHTRTAPTLCLLRTPEGYSAPCTWGELSPIQTVLGPCPPVVE